MPDSNPRNVERQIEPDDSCAKRIGAGEENVIHERLAGSQDQSMQIKTMWASAYVSSGIDGVTLEIKMLDFRIMWADEARANRAPRDKAIGAVTL